MAAEGQGAEGLQGRYLWDSIRMGLDRVRFAWQVPALVVATVGVEGEQN
jgi:hypothetical protein